MEGGTGESPESRKQRVRGGQDAKGGKGESLESRKQKVQEWKGRVRRGAREENMLFLDDAAGAGRARGSLEQRGLKLKLVHLLRYSSAFPRTRTRTAFPSVT